MNDLDTGAVAHAVDSLLNFETVKYFGAEERERGATARAIARLCQCRGQSARIQPRLAQYRPGADHQSDDGGRAMALVVWGWSQGASRRRRRAGQHLLSQLFRPLDCSAWSIARSARALIDMGRCST
jgi:hypothetical protein